MISLKEYIADKACENTLFEMASNRSEFLDKLDNLHEQIIENWCLIRYCIVFDNKNINKNHWRKELSAHLYNIVLHRYDVNRINAIKEVYLRKLRLDNSNVIYNIISKKWSKENLDIEADYTSTIIEDFIQYGLFEIIEVLSKKNTNKEQLTDYTYSI